MPDDLDQVAAATSKNVEITGMRIPLHTLLEQTRKAGKAAAHIDVAGRKPHPHITRYGNHRRSSTSRTRANDVRVHSDASPVAKLDLDQSNTRSHHRPPSAITRR